MEKAQSQKGSRSKSSQTKQFDARPKCECAKLGRPFFTEVFLLASLKTKLNNDALKNPPPQRTKLCIADQAPHRRLVSCHPASRTVERLQMAVFFKELLETERENRAIFQVPLF